MRNAALRPQARFHHDPRVLEADFVAALERAISRRADVHAPPRIAVVAPTRRLVDRLARVAVDALGALAGVRFFVHRGLASHVLAEAGVEPARELRAPLAAALLRPRIAASGSALASYFEAHPPAIGVLLATFRDLRDAGVDAGSLARVEGLSATARQTAALFAAWEELLSECESSGLHDPASRVRRACAVAGEQPRCFDALLHYGAYDLIGVHRDLVAAIARDVATELFVPAVAGHELPVRLADALGAETVRAPETPPPPAPHPVVSAAGPREEIRHAVRRLLAWHESDGVAFDEMAILARSGGPYAEALAAETALLEIEPDSSERRALSATPRARALRWLLEAWHSPRDRRLRERAHCAVPADWRDPEGAEARFHSARSAVERLEAVKSLVASPPDDPVALLVAGVVEDARRLQESGGRLAAGLDGADAATLLLAFLAEARVRDERAKIGGLQFLDFHQARGLPLRRAVLIGANERLLPRRSAEDFFLPDDDRLRIAQATGRPLPRKREARAEESLLADVVRLAVSERLEISFARATDERDEAVSPWLGRFTATPPEQARVLARHPLRELDRLLESTRVLRPEEALVAAAALDADGALSLARRLALARLIGSPHADALARGLQRMAAVDSYGTAPLRFDGSVGELGAKASWTPSELDRLGRCPLQYFFHDELKVEPLERAQPSGELDPRAFGSLCHDVLRDLYREILPAGKPPIAGAFERAQDLLPRLIDERLKAVEQAGGIAPALRPIRLESIARALTAFVRRDLEWIAAQGLLGGDYELPQAVDLGSPSAPLPVSLRFDRILRDEAGREWIGDYKSSSLDTLKESAKFDRIVRGRGLQLPVYLLARLGAGAEVAGLSLMSLRETDDDDEAMSTELDVARLVGSRAQLQDVLQGLAALRAAGHFPMHAEDDLERGQCGRCDYRRACRTTHGATRERVGSAVEFAKYFAMTAAASTPASAAMTPRKPRTSGK